LAALWLAGGGIGTAGAFQISGDSWPGPEIVMELQLGPTSGPLLDGSADWGQAAESALATWNVVIASAQFRVVRDSVAPILFRNAFNNVYFGATVDGRSFAGAVAITIYRTRSSEIFEADVVFNSNLDFNSYRGPLRRSVDGGTLYDLRRVALHEFGHVLGLDHPDQAGQFVAAIMNSRVSNVDDLLRDDIAGARAIYGAEPGETAGSGEPARVIKPGNRTTTTQNRRFTVRGIASRFLGARRVVLVNNRFRREEFRADGLADWSVKVDLRRGRNRIKVFVEDRDGDRTRVRSLLVRRRGRG
jgi:hypothetical protein